MIVDKVSVNIDKKSEERSFALKDVLNPVQVAILYSNRDINKKGTQQTLQKRLIDAGLSVAQSTISDWVKKGYVTRKYAKAVSEISGVSLQELTQSSPFKKA